MYGYFNHVKFLADEVSVLLTAVDCASYADQGAGSCERQVFAPITAGMVIGQIGRLQGNFDFGTLDMRVTHAFANPDRYEYARTPHIVCPYDYYEGDLKRELYSLLPRTEEPEAGRVWFARMAQATLPIVVRLEADIGLGSLVVHLVRFARR